MSEKSGGDFRYSVGESKVPWHAVGEFFDGSDALELVKFLLPDNGEADYAVKLANAAKALSELSDVAGRATKLTLGKKVADAEALACEYFGSKYACFISNWTGGMEIAYKLAGISAGDEVIMPAVTFIATMAYPLSVGAKIVFADIDPETINLDPADLERKITPKTKMIVPVHLGGFPVDMDGVMAVARKHGIMVMEDAAHGMGGAYKGKKLGSIGDFGGFSLHEVKNINSLGEGGVLLTSDDAFGSQLAGGRFLGLDFTRKIKDWLYDISPLTARDGSIQVAQNHSATEIQALGLIQQMKRYDRILAERRRESTYMTERLSGNPAIIPQDLGNADIDPTFHLYLLQIDPEKAGGDVQKLKQKLDAKGVTNIPHFGPLYRFAAVREMGQDPEAAAASCPVCEDVFDRRFTHLPIYGLSDEQLKYMADAILESVKEMQEGR